MNYKILFINPCISEVERNLLRGVLSYARDFGPWDISIFPPQQDKIALIPRGNYVGCLGLLGRPDLAEAIRKHHRPAINISGGETDFGLPQVGVSDLEIGYMAADYLTRQGFVEFAFFGLNGEDFSDTRRKGFAQGLGGRNARVHVYDAQTTYPDSPRLKKVSGDLASYPPVRWLAQLPPQTGILASDDIRGNDIGNWAMHLGLRMPEDIGLLSVGNDDIRCETTVVPMSSIEVPAEEIGYEAARALDFLLQGKKNLKFPHFRPPTRVIERQSTNLLKVTHPNVTKALAYMHERGRDKIVAEDIAKAAGMSLRSLERIFQKILHRTIQQELIRMRLEWAQKDLRSTEKNLDTIGADCGLNSGVYLSQLFKKTVGLSPGEYRKQFRH
jgi:LacI family transcriptional regulator